MEEHQVPAEKEAQTYSVPWSVGDTWLGVILLIVLSVGMLVAVFMGINAKFMQNIGVLFLEMIYILPIALIFLWRQIHWKYLGFGTFTLDVIGIGCGLLIGGYAIIIAHNALLYAFGIEAQGDQIFDIFDQLESPIWFFITGAVIARADAAIVSTSRGGLVFPRREAGGPNRPVRSGDPQSAPCREPLTNPTARPSSSEQRAASRQG